MNSGCTANLLSCQLFDTVSAKDKASLEPQQGEPGAFADVYSFLWYS